MSTRTTTLAPEARGLSTAAISDALDALRLPGIVLGVGHIAGVKRVFGPAFTVQYIPVDVNAPGTVGDYLDDTPVGAVVVLDNAGRTDCTVWGGILSHHAARRGIAGTPPKRTRLAIRYTLEAASCGLARTASRCRR
jgi:regulator of RNase E activity RraA